MSAPTAPVNDYLNLVRVFSAWLYQWVWGQSSNVTIGACSVYLSQLTGIRNRTGQYGVYINVVASKDYYYNICGYTDASLAAANQAAA